MPRLSNLEALEVSFVPVGMNKRKFLLLKSKQGGSEMKTILKSILETNLENEKEIDAKIESMLSEEIKKEGGGDKVKAAVKGALRLLGSVKESIPKEGNDLMNLLSAGLGKKVEPKVKKEGKEPKETPVTKEGNKMDPKMEEKLEKLWKSHESVTKENKGLREENKGIKEEIKKERDLRVTKEFEVKAEGYKNLGKSSSELGAVLKSASEKMTEEEYKKFEGVLKSADARAEASELFTELGTSQGDTGQFGGKLKVAKEAIMKANPELTPEQAEEQAYDNEPGLYNSYLDENPKQGGR